MTRRSIAAGFRCSFRILARFSVVLLVAPGAVNLHSDWTPAAERVSYVAHRVYTTGIGEHATEILPGGAQVTLNTDTRVRAHATEWSNSVFLETGEALFDNIARESMPMSVAAGTVTFHAKHARFSLYRLSDDAYIANVFEGKLTVTPRGMARGYQAYDFPPFEMKAGRRAVFRTGQILVSRFTAEEGENLLSWTAGMLTFEHATLMDATLEMNRYNRQKIVIADRSITQLLVSGTYTSTGPETFARALETLFPIRATFYRTGGRSAGLIVLTRRTRTATERS